MNTASSLLQNRLGELEFNLILTISENEELKAKIEELTKENEKLKKGGDTNDNK